MKWNDPESKTPQEVRDAKEERDDEAFAAMYETVAAERAAQGNANAPIMIVAEAKRRLRAANP